MDRVSVNFSSASLTSVNLRCLVLSRRVQETCQIRQINREPEIMEEKGFVDASDSVLISDLLYYVSNKLKCLPVKEVATICHQFYTDDSYVFEQKKKLYVAIRRDCSGRKKEDKRLKNINDICTTILECDAKNSFLPKFASLDFNNVPLNDDGNPSLGQIMAAINDLKRTSVTKNMLEQSLNDFKGKFSPSISLSPSTPTEEEIVNVDLTAAAVQNGENFLASPFVPETVSSPVVTTAPSYSQISSSPPVRERWE